MGDSDETPPDRPGRRHPRLQSATGRETVSERNRRDRVKTPARGVTIGRPSLSTDQLDQLELAVEGRTVTVDAIPEEVTFDSISGVTEIMREDPQQRAIVGLIAKERAHRANEIMKAMGEKPPNERMSATEKAIRWLKWLFVVVVVPAVSALLVVGKFLMSKAATDERALIEREELIERSRDYEQRLRALEAVTPRYPFPPGPTRPEPTPSRKEPSP